ncbi:hypothetical protein Slin14017_G123250 [Septoria linicola]|nr:hypothetical protein Slin14017_G123250 [Septoria linicola]
MSARLRSTERERDSLGEQVALLRIYVQQLEATLAKYFGEE